MIQRGISIGLFGIGLVLVLIGGIRLLLQTYETRLIMFGFLLIVSAFILRLTKWRD